ncbi:MAG: L,D-transpeptidase family protein [Deltaproteobacteria bacterium]|nr:L,D-transpeptidase family protein [Deltaproteobacteria bacterium]
MSPAWLLVIVTGCTAAQRTAIFERDMDFDDRGPAGVGEEVAKSSEDKADKADDPVLGARSVTFTADVPVRAEPSAASARIGVVGRDARARPLRAKPPGGGCERRWIEIAPRGWVCESNLGPTSDAPSEGAPVALDDATAPELGKYGRVHGSAWVFDGREDLEAERGRAIDVSTTVRSTGVVGYRGARYWTTSNDAYIQTKWITPFVPSDFHGVPIRDGELRVAWAHKAGSPKSAVPLRARPRPDAPVVGHLDPRAQVDVLETSPDGRFVRIGEAGWVARANLRMPVVTTPPEGVGANEHWFDIDLDEQTLVAYEGARPVYATLVSSGRSGFKTPPGIARIESKLRMTTMVGTQPGDEYSMADVPWTMFFDGSLAMHGAYWHDGFGDVRSHGCVNLAPRDARILYDFASPDAPPGWTIVYPDAKSPGSLIRFRGKP